MSQTISQFGKMAVSHLISQKCDLTRCSAKGGKKRKRKRKRKKKNKSQSWPAQVLYKSGQDLDFRIWI
jgi:hypothetical protein